MVSITNDDKIKIKNIIKKNGKIVYSDQDNIIETRKILYEKKHLIEVHDHQLSNKKIY